MTGPPHSARIARNLVITALIPVEREVVTEKTPRGFPTYDDMCEATFRCDVGNDNFAHRECVRRRLGFVLAANGWCDGLHCNI